MTATQAPTPGPLDSESVKLLVKGDVIECLSDAIAPKGTLMTVTKVDDGGIDVLDRGEKNSFFFGTVAGSFRLAPTAPVEASGSELGYEIGGVVQRLHDCLDGATRASVSVDTGDLKAALTAVEAQLNNLQRPFDNVVACEASDLRTIISNLRPQPSGETRFGDETAEQIVKRWAAWINEVSEDMEEPEWGGKTRNDVLNERDFLIRCLSARPLALDLVSPRPLDLGRVDDDASTLSTTPARAEAQNEGAAGEPSDEQVKAACVAFLRAEGSDPFNVLYHGAWCGSFPHQTGPERWTFKVEAMRAALAAARAHPSPTPAADADRVRSEDDVRLLMKSRSAIEAGLATLTSLGATQGGRVSLMRQTSAEITEALKSTAAKEGGEA